MAGHPWARTGWRPMNREGWLVAAGRAMLGCKAVKHLQAVGTDLHACCRHPAPLQGSHMATYLLGSLVQVGGTAAQTCNMHGHVCNMHGHTCAICMHTCAICMHTHLPLLPPTLHHPDDTLAPLVIAASPMSSGIHTLSAGTVSALPCHPSKGCKDPFQARCAQLGGVALQGWEPPSLPMAPLR